MQSIRILDCTLRDGGFINDWEFGHEDIINIFERAVSANTDIIEVGFIDERRSYDTNRTILPDGESVNTMFADLDHGNSMVVGMIDYGTCSIDKILPCEDSIMDGIRVIFKKKNMPEAIEYCSALKDKGYKVFVQPVSITGYSDEEMLQLVGMVNDFMPYAMSMVDTYGLLHEGGLLHYYELMDGHLDKSISLGYHAHNNFQLGYSNSLALIEHNMAKPEDKRRQLVVDGSLFGMGKGAGNAPIELLAMYMNQHYEGKYDISQMLESIDVSIMKVYLKLPWGYSLKYFLAASNDCHPNYVQHLMQKRTLSVKSINEILDKISTDKKLAYNAEHIEELYRDYQAHDIDDKGVCTALSQLLSGQTILVMGPGKTIQEESARIQAFMAEKKPVVIAVNFLPEKYYTDYVFISNAKRYVSLESRLIRGEGVNKSAKVIATSNITRARGSFDYRVDYQSLLDPSFEIPDSSLIMIMKLLTRLGVKEVNLAGFDGYTSSPGDNYFNVAMEYAFIKEKAAVLNEYTRNSLEKLSENVKINFITKSRYI